MGSQICVLRILSILHFRSMSRQIAWLSRSRLITWRWQIGGKLVSGQISGTTETIWPRQMISKQHKQRLRPRSRQHKWSVISKQHKQRLRPRSRQFPRDHSQPPRDHHRQGIISNRQRPQQSTTGQFPRDHRQFPRDHHRQFSRDHRRLDAFKWTL